MTPAQCAAHRDATHGPAAEVPVAVVPVPVRARRRRFRRRAALAAGLVLLGGGAGAAVARTAGPATTTLHSAAPPPTPTATPTPTAAPAAAAGSEHLGVPPEFRAACGHPGATVVLRSASGTVRGRDCDLRGVLLASPGAVGVTVPTDPGSAAASPGGATVTLRADGDVTYTRGQPCPGPAGTPCL